MKRGCLVFLLVSISGFFPEVVTAFDMMGLQPATPHGVFSTFGTYSLHKEGTAIELGIERSREPDFYRFSLRGAYGLTDNVELLINVPYVDNFHESHDGLEDVGIGMKHRFYDEGKYGPSLAYLIHATIAAGEDEFSTDGSLGLGFIMSKRIGPIMGHTNILYKVPGKSRLNSEITLSGGIEFSAAHNFDILGEILARKGYYSKEYNQIEGRIGYRIRTTDSIYTTLGVGVDLKNRTPEYRLILLVSLVSPAEKKKITKIYEEE